MRFNNLRFTTQMVFAVSVAIFVFVSPLQPSFAQEVPSVEATPIVDAPVQEVPRITGISVVGNERVEPSTIASYLAINIGDPFDPALMDQSLKNLYATGLFNDVSFSIRGSTLLITVLENPIINRIVFEGNKKLDNEDLLEEVRLRPRIVYTRAKVRADVQRMLELYRKKGRFAAIIEPKVIQLEQNRVDLVFEIEEGPKTKVRRINFIGNHEFSDKKLRGELTTTEARWWRLLSSTNTYDPDLLAYDQTLIREFYLNEGYADFRIASAVAELTPDREDFFYTYVIEEGDIYEFGALTVESDIRDIKAKAFQNFILMKEGQQYNIEAIEATTDFLTSQVGTFGYAFVDVYPEVTRDRESRKINIVYKIAQAPRVYVERINVNGNIRTLDRVVRREFRVLEGDTFNAAGIDRSEQRVQRLNFFREVEVERSQGSLPDRMVLDVNVEEQATGELNIGAGFSSLENFIFDFSIAERNLMGKGQTLKLTTRMSGYRQEIDLGFSEPYFQGRNVSAGFNLFSRRIEQSQQSLYDIRSNGGSVSLGFALNEYWILQNRYTIRFDNITMPTFLLDSYYAGSVSLDAGTGLPTDPAILAILDTNNDGQVDDTEKLVALPTYLQETLGKHTQSILGYTIGFDRRDSTLYPTRGSSFYFTQDFAGLGGSVKYLKNRLNFDWYKTPWKGWTFKLAGEAGHVMGLGDNVRASDRYYLGGPQVRGFEILGIGPRDISQGGRAIGGKHYYTGRAELFVPMGEAALEMGLRASLFADTGALWGADPAFSTITGDTTNLIVNDTRSPRLSVGVGVSWDSPFGPFRIDLSKTLRKQPLDQTKTLQFNVGYNF